MSLETPFLGNEFLCNALPPSRTQAFFGTAHHHFQYANYAVIKPKLWDSLINMIRKYPGNIIYYVF